MVVIVELGGNLRWFGWETRGLCKEQRIRYEDGRRLRDISGVRWGRPYYFNRK